MRNGIDEPADGFWWTRFDGALRVVRIVTSSAGIRTVSCFGYVDLLEVFKGDLIRRIDEPSGETNG